MFNVFVVENIEFDNSETEAPTAEPTSDLCRYLYAAESLITRSEVKSISLREEKDRKDTPHHSQIFFVSRVYFLFRFLHFSWSIS